MAGYVGPNKVTPGVAEYIDWVPLAKATLTDHVSVTFDGLSSGDFDVYRFVFVNVHMETDGAEFQFQGNASGQTGFNETMSTILMTNYQNEGDSDAQFLGPNTSFDLTQETGYATLAVNQGSDADQQLVGWLEIFAPASTTYVKHFLQRCVNMHQSDYVWHMQGAGYFNTTSAIEQISFKSSSGEIQDGIITMFGLNQ